MTPRTKKPRPSLFPAYAPPEQPDLTIEDLARHIGGYIQSIATRLAQFATLIAAIGGGTAYVASSGKASTPTTAPTSSDATIVARIKALEDTAISQARQISEGTALTRSVLYISCETLAKVQPERSIPPLECRR